MNNEQTSAPVSLSVPTTKILAIGRLTEKAANAEERTEVLKREVPATVQLYLSGSIEQWWFKTDSSGVVFILNFANVKEAGDLLETLPLGVAGMMEFDLIPLGPLAPLRALLPDAVVA